MFEPGKIVKIFKSKKGKNILIRYPKSDDLEDLLEFVNTLSREDTFISLSGEVISTEEETEFLNKLLKDMKENNAYMLLAYVGEKLVGNCGINKGKRRKKHVGTLGIMLRKGFREEGIGSEMLKILITESRKMGLLILELHAFSQNEKAIHVYEKLGFVQIGRGHGMFRYKDGFDDEIWMMKRIDS